MKANEDIEFTQTVQDVHITFNPNSLIDGKPIGKYIADKIRDCQHIVRSQNEIEKEREVLRRMVLDQIDREEKMRYGYE